MEDPDVKVGAFARMAELEDAKDKMFTVQDRLIQ